MFTVAGWNEAMWSSNKRRQSNRRTLGKTAEHQCPMQALLGSFDARSHEIIYQIALNFSTIFTIRRALVSGVLGSTT